MLKPPKLIYYRRNNGALTTFRYRLREEVECVDYQMIEGIDHETYLCLKRVSSQSVIDHRTPIFDQREPVKQNTEEML